MIEAHLEELAALRHELEGWIARCDANQEEQVCPPLRMREMSPSIAEPANRLNALGH